MRSLLIHVVAFAAALLLAGNASAEVTFDIIGVGAATAISADGTVVAGNTYGEYETFRWTEQTGIVPLGRASVPVLGRGAGTPDISADGSRISATILGVDSTYITQGVWIDGTGWLETMPPTPPDGGTIDLAYGSAWGLSDDGEALVGLYWRPGHGGPDGDGLAHASIWTEATGVVDLGSGGRDSRANDCNADGSVVVGWDSNPDFGNWWPTVWVDGVRTVLAQPDAWCEASVVTPDGMTVFGQTFDADAQLTVAAAWHWNGTAWDEEVLGTIPGTFPLNGSAYPNDATPDGSIVVGYNPYHSADVTGFLWTAATGMTDIEDFLVDNGVELDPLFDIQTVTAISDDGTTMVGIGGDIFPPFLTRSFIIHTDVTTAIAEQAVPVVTPTLVRAAPNPTFGAATFAIDLPASARVELAIFDSTGRMVRSLRDGAMPSGRQSVEWDGRDEAGGSVASGVYYYRLNAGTHTETHKLTVVR